jgi:hypothetical protein
VSTGELALLIENVGAPIAPCAVPLLPALLRECQVEAAQNRHHAVYAIGCLVRLLPCCVCFGHAAALSSHAPAHAQHAHSLVAHDHNAHCERSRVLVFELILLSLIGMRLAREQLRVHHTCDASRLRSMQLSRSCSLFGQNLPICEKNIPKLCLKWLRYCEWSSLCLPTNPEIDAVAKHADAVLS